MSEAVEGAAVGAVAGVLAGLLGEAMTHLVRLAFPTDVWIVGFALSWGLALGALIGGVGGWHGWLRGRYRLAVVAAVPGLLAGVATAVMQWGAV